jgi:hypothetical protein
MTSEQPQPKAAPSKTIRRQYGPICPGCGRVIPIGAEDVAHDVDISTFREILRRQGYKVKQEHCLAPNCGHSIEAKLHLVQFGKPDDTLPAEKTF